jgi:glycosyltransferase involved in cell wall biosynthesis
MTHSVVIVTRNRPHEVERLLRALAEQTVVPDEVLLIDASDAAVDGERPHIPEGLALRMIPSRAGLSAQRNIGLREARGEILTYFDDDAVPANVYCERVLSMFRSDDSVVALGGINKDLPRVGALEYALRVVLQVQTRRGTHGYRRSGFPDRMLPSTALSLRRIACDGLSFEERWLSGEPLGLATGRCFGEDAYFTAQLAERGTMRLCPGAAFRHVPSSRTRESTFITQALYVYSLRWISDRAARTRWARALRVWALLGQGMINLAQSLRFAHAGYLRGYLRALRAPLR